MKLKHLLGWFCYWLCIDAIFYCVNRRAKRVVTFHNVLPDDVCKNMPRIPVAVRASRFRAMIREATRFLNADADLDAPGSLTITFDDGYTNQYEIAARILDEEGIHAAVLFVTDRVLNAHGCDSALWADRELHQNLVFSKEYERLRLTGITLDQIEDLRKRGWKVGYHTKTHRRLSDLSDSEKMDELSRPKWLKDRIVSYPFGWEKDVDAKSVALVAEYGYERGFSNQSVATPRISQFFLPRMVLMPNKYWIHFELSGAKYFFKYRKLLPR